MKEVSKATLNKWRKFKKENVKDVKPNKERVSNNCGRPPANK